MSINLKWRSLLSLLDLSSEEINYLLNLSEKLKWDKKKWLYEKHLQDKNIALIFEKSSTRTRCAFVVAAFDEWAHPEYLWKDDIQLGKKETVADTARVLWRLFDGIEFRWFKQETVEWLAKYAWVPVWNWLTDLYHPTQVLADLMTIKEHFGKIKDIKFAYVGDGRNNMGNTLMIGAAKMWMDFRIWAPKNLFPEEHLIQECQKIAETTWATLRFFENPKDAVKDCDVIYTDVWVSMWEEALFKERIKLLTPYQVNTELMKSTWNDKTIFLHCLPAFHNLDTTVWKEIFQKYGIREMEVTEEVFESQQSYVFDQAENRMHTIKALMVATI